MLGHHVREGNDNSGRVEINRKTFSKMSEKKEIEELPLTPNERNKRCLITKIFGIS